MNADLKNFYVLIFIATIWVQEKMVYYKKGHYDINWRVL